MNYYEYAPPIFRWFFGNTEVKPWEMFPWFWGSFLLLSLILAIFGGVQLFRKKHRIIYSILLFLGILGIVLTPFLDKFYLDYEWRNALSQPGYYINKQVKADNYAKVESLYFFGPGGNIGREQFLQLPSLRVDKNRYTHTEFKAKEIFCSIYELGPYQFIEEGYINYKFENGKKGGLNLGGEDLDDSTKKLGEKGHSSYGVRYTEKREDGCYLGTRDHVQSRYYVMNENRVRVGLALARERTVIVDSQTGDVLGYANFFSSDRNVLFKLTFGLLDSVLLNGISSKIVSTSNSDVIQYRKKTNRYSETTYKRLTRYVLIPTYYYENPEGDVL